MTKHIEEAALQAQVTPVVTYDLTHPREDSSYWGKVITDLVKDPRNPTPEEWAKLRPVYDYLTPPTLGDQDWKSADAVARAIAKDEGIIPMGRAETTIREPKYTAGDAMIGHPVPKNKPYVDKDK